MAGIQLSSFFVGLFALVQVPLTVVVGYRRAQTRIGLARSLWQAFPADPEAAGLLVLLLLHDARRGARSSEDGEPVPLPEQDRGRWDYAAIATATQLLEQTLAVGRPGPFQIEATISAVHCRAVRSDDTDWGAQRPP